MPELAWNAFDLDEYKNRLLHKVDAAVEAERLKEVTPGSAQAMVYLQKASEAERYLADNTVDTATIPHIVEEANELGLTLLEAAQRVKDRHDAWNAMSSALESRRQRAKHEIRNATTIAAARQAANVDWASILANA